MNNIITIFFAVVVLLLLPLLAWVFIHNGLVSKEEAVSSAWGQVESNYQRRNDLIPVLVESASRYIKHEVETLSAVMEQRAKPYTDLQDAVTNLQTTQADSTNTMQELGGKPPIDEALLSRIAISQEKVFQGMKGLLAVVENYPELRSSDQFMSLQAQLEGTENRINIARIQFNRAAQAFNAAIRKMPHNLVASANNMGRKAYFNAEEGASKAKPLNME
ncbi:MAG: LemA family protein [Sedimenticola sp.]